MTVPLASGRYEILRPIASGGMATVYLARSIGARGFERPVALKVMHPHLAQDPDFVTMFLDEARMAANVRHPNVVPTLDVVEEGDQLFLVMEYVEGRSLHSLVRARRKAGAELPKPIALRIVLDMLAGLDAAHELTMPGGAPMNLVHRDVSPQNVIVGNDGIARLVDFGIARAEIRVAVTVATSPKGKVPYMSPEQVRAERVDRRSDVYAAGIVLWELLAGRRLFRADNQGALINLVLEGATQSPAAAAGHEPGPIDEVCMRALDRSLEWRYPTAAAFADALEDAAQRAGVQVASHRAVAAYVGTLPPEEVRGHDAARAPRTDSDPVSPHGSAGEGSAAPMRDVGLTPSMVPSVEAREGAARARGVRVQHVLAAVILASLATGLAVWLALRSPEATDAMEEPPATAGTTVASAEVVPAPPAADPPPEPPAAASAAPASSSSTPIEKPPRAGGAATSFNGWTGRPRKPGSRTFRPEEP